MQLGLARAMRTALAVLFCCLLAACAAPQIQPPQFASRIAWKENHSLAPGETFSLRLWKLEETGERRILASNEGPARAACTHGCGSISSQVNANPGQYRMEVENDRHPGTASLTFNVKANEFWVLIISDAATPQSFRPLTGDSIVARSETGAYRIDALLTGALDTQAP